MALNQNNLKRQPILVVPRQMQLVNPDGTPTRSGQLLLQQSLNSMVTYGAAGAMTDTTGLQDGALYVVEGQNDQLLYQVQNGNWHYIAGTMWGTLSPDQRPVGLGPNDAGFDFRSIDADPRYGGREFIWSGSEWVEVTPAMSGTHANRPNPLGMAYGSLYAETDRGNVVYQVQPVSGSPAWVYIAGSMYGTVIAADQRPTGLGANDTGFVFVSSDSTSVKWSGTSWNALGRILDLGPSPVYSQLVVKTNAAGALSLLNFAGDTGIVGFGVEWQGSQWIARDVNCAWISKQGSKLTILRSSGNTIGGVTSPSDALTVDLTTGNVGIGPGTTAPNVQLSMGSSAVSKKLGVYDATGTFYGFGIRVGFLEYHAPSGGGHSFFANETGELMRLNSSGSIQMYLGGTLKTLSVDSNGFVKAA